MRPYRTLKLVFALLLIATLPLRGFAATAHCESDGRAIHAVQPTHCHENGRLHACGDCCGVAAIAIAPAAPQALARPPAEHIGTRAAVHPPRFGLDRLDRPPRLTI